MSEQETADAGPGWAIERKGIDWVEDSERHGRPRNLFWPWIAATASFFTVAYGVFVVGLGLSWWQGVIAVVVGMSLSYPVVGLVAVAGTRGNAPTMTLSRAAFGYHGNKLPTLFVYVSLVGWETISVALGALATRTILERVSPGLGGPPMLAAGFAITVVIVMFLGIYGYSVIVRVQRWITVAVVVSIAAYFVVIIPTLDFSTATTGGGGALAVVGGISFVIATGIGWTPAGADYSRYMPRSSSPAAVAGWTTLGVATVPAIMMLFGVLLTAGNPQLAAATAADPIGAFAAALPTWFLIPFLATTMLSIIAGSTFNLYSSGMALLALGVRLPRTVAIFIDGILMTLGGIYLVFVSPSFFAPVQALLIVIGVVAAAWSAIFVVDLAIHRRQGYLKDALYVPTGAYGRYNPAGLLALIVAVVLGFGLITSRDPHVGAILGYFLSSAAKSGSVGASNIGVAVAFVAAGALYAVLSTTVFRSSAGAMVHERSGG